MNASNFSYFLRNPSHLYKISHQELQNLVLQYPYCQNLRYLLVKKSQMEKHRDYQRDLQLAATYSVDRKYLYYQINSQNDSTSTDDYLFNDDYLELKNISEDNTLPTEIHLEELAPSDNVVNDQNSANINAIDKSVEPEAIEQEDDNNDFAEAILLENLVHVEKTKTNETNLIDEILEDENLEEDANGHQASDLKKEIESVKETETPTEKTESQETTVLNENITEQSESDFKEIIPDIENPNELQEIDELSVEEFKAQQEIPETEITPKKEPVKEEIKAVIIEKKSEKKIEKKELKRKEKKRPENEDLLSLLAKYSKENKKVRKIRKIKKKKIEEQPESSPSNKQPEVTKEAQNAAIIDELISEMESKEELTKLPSKATKDIPLQIVNEEKTIDLQEQTTIDNDLKTPSKTITTTPVENTSFEKAVETIIEKSTEKKKDKKKHKHKKKAAPTKTKAHKKKNKDKKKVIQFTSLKEKDSPTLLEKAKKKKSKDLENEIFSKPKESITDFKKHKHKKKKAKKKIQAKQKKEKLKTHPTKKKKSTKDTIKFAKKSIEKNNNAISETLAKLLAQQGHHDLAILMYKKLSLIFPEKSTLFAREIKKLKNI